MITLVVARARNGAIGKGNTIPWRAPEDLAFFQRETTGGAVIMGRKTWESLPFKPLKNRLNIVVSSNPDVADIVCPDPAAAVAHAQAAGHARIYGIGGQAIYRHLLPLARRLLVTEVGTTVEDADAFFPEFDPKNWQLITTMPLRAADPVCVLTEYLRA